MAAKRRERAAQKPHDDSPKKQRQSKVPNQETTSKSPLTAPEDKVLPTPIAERSDNRQTASDDIPISVASNQSLRQLTSPQRTTMMTLL